MSLTSDVLDLSRDPRELLHQRLREPPATHHLIVATILPLLAIRSIAVLLRSVVQTRPVAGMVLGVSSLALQVGCLIGLTIVLPAVVRQFRGEISDRQSFVLAAYASVPLWLAGSLYLAPEEPFWLLFVSRAAVVAAASYGVYLLHAGLEEAEIQSRQLIVGAVAGAYVTLYAVLFVLLGVTSHVMLIVLRS